MLLTHFSREPLEPLYNSEQSDVNTFKPEGFWLSDESDYGWSEWCQGNDFPIGKIKTHFEVDLTDVLHIKTAKELFDFQTKYFSKSPSIMQPWFEVAKDYKGILITPYLWSVRRIPWYYSWDVASGCFWDVSCLKQSNKEPSNEKSSLSDYGDAFSQPYLRTG